MFAELGPSSSRAFPSWLELKLGFRYLYTRTSFLLKPGAGSEQNRSIPVLEKCDYKQQLEHILTLPDDIKGLEPVPC